jgi:lysophospholipase L1-like esterase
MRRIAVILFALMSIWAFVQPEKPTIFLAGDSTMATKKTKAFPETGWGQVLSSFADTSRIAFQNFAKNGRSTKSFIAEGLWGTIMARVKPGDYVFIEFGHNDEKITKPAVYARAETKYRENLLKFITETRAKGATPVLLTSITRRSFDSTGLLRFTHEMYPVVMRKLCKEQKVTLIDLEVQTHLMVQELGKDASKKLYLHFPAGTYPNRMESVADDTHLSRLGALKVANLVVESIRKQIPELACYF